MYYGGVGQAGTKLAKQAYEIIPKTIKAGGDGVYGPEMLTAVGYPAVEGWYATIASPHLTEDGKLTKWVAAYKAKFGVPPEDYSITAYDGALVIIAAAKKIAASGKPVDRVAVRDAIEADKVSTLQGDVSFDANGDLKSKVVSVFQIHKNDAKPLDDIDGQYKYIGVAPQA